jgi:hypothetical protein
MHNRSHNPILDTVICSIENTTITGQSIGIRLHGTDTDSAQYGAFEFIHTLDIPPQTTITVTRSMLRPEYNKPEVLSLSLSDITVFLKSSQQQLVIKSPYGTLGKAYTFDNEKIQEVPAAESRPTMGRS